MLYLVTKYMLHMILRYQKPETIFKGKTMKLRPPHNENYFFEMKTMHVYGNYNRQLVN